MRRRATFAGQSTFPPLAKSSNCLVPKMEHAILDCASYLGEDTEVLLGKASDAESPLRAWYTEARRANWRSPQDVKALYRTASILRSNRVAFNVKGNTYRLVVAVKYEFQVVYIRFIGTHAEYDKIKAEEV
jgi:mRNA interferase HigB